MKKSFCAIGIDVGGTKIAAGLVTFPEGRVRARRQIPTQRTRDGESILKDVLHLCEELASKARVDGIGVGVCELVDVAGNVMSENCVPWKGMDMRKRLSKVAPAIVEADVRAAALAEALFGAGKAFRQFVYVTVGTGISCSLVLDGKPFTGARGATGTMASSPYLNGRTVEDIASGPALVARYNQRQRASAARPSSAEAVLAEAAAGNRDAIEVVRTGGEALGAAVGLMVNVLDPEAVIVGGGLGLSQGLYWDTFVTATGKHIWSEVHRDLPILQAKTGTDAGVIGSAAYAWQKLCKMDDSASRVLGPKPTHGNTASRARRRSASTRRKD